MLASQLAAVEAMSFAYWCMLAPCIAAGHEVIKAALLLCPVSYVLWHRCMKSGCMTFILCAAGGQDSGQDGTSRVH